MPDDLAPKDPERLKSSTILAGRYAIEGVLGTGGMGAVYLARDLHFPSVIKQVAVKEVINRVSDQETRELLQVNFEREANLLASLNHPSIPRIYDFFSEGINSYLVMEYILGKDLARVIHDTPEFLPEIQIIQWGIEMCEVLSYLHHHQPEPIIFRDIKPSNIIINLENRVVLIDFGIARGFQTGLKGTVMGTEGYAPPEQYRGEASPRGDIYALGATLHHALTRIDPQREPPFTFNERRIRVVNPSASVDIETAIHRAVEYSPEKRFQSVEVFRDELERIRLGGQPMPSAASSFGGTVRLPDLPDVAEEVAYHNTAQKIWSFECEDEIRGSPAFDDGVLYAGSLDHNLYALDAVEGSLLWKYPTEGGLVARPLVHEHFVYMGSEDGFVHVVSSSSGRKIWSFQAGGMIRSSAKVFGDFLFFGADDHFLYTVDINTGRLVWRFEASGAVRSTPLIYNKQIIFGCESGDLYSLDFFGTIKWQAHARRGVTSSPACDGERIYFASMDGTLYAYDARMGWETWRYRMPKGSISSPCISDSMVLIGCIDGCIYAVDAYTGREVWVYRTGHQVTGSVTARDGQVYCGSVDGNMYCLERATGQLAWKFKTGGPITGTPLFVNDMLYFGSTDHRVYAVGV